MAMATCSTPRSTQSSFSASTSGVLLATGAFVLLPIRKLFYIFCREK